MLNKQIKKRPRFAILLVGLISLIWFLIRVIPKPVRASYPCQKAAFPFASTFVIWVIGVLSGKYFFRKARINLMRNNYFLLLIFLIATVLSFTFITLPFSSVTAAFKSSDLADFEPADSPNQPIGVAKGIFPGRVVWCYNPNATSWSGVTGKSGVDVISGATTPVPDGEWFLEGNIIQSQVDVMISESICSLAGENSDNLSWDAIFRYFNLTHQRGEIGYQQGEKIAVKINLNNCTSHGIMNGSSNISPQMALGLLRQLVLKANVPAEYITFYDVSRQIPSTIYDLCKQEFPGVNFVDQVGEDGRIKGIADYDSRIRWSEELILEPLAVPAYPAYLPTCVTESQYIINFSNLKAHTLAGISLCSKNMFGSFISPNSSSLQPPQAAGIHPYIAVKESDGYDLRPMESYNALVDLMGDNNLGGKTLLFLIDGLFAASWQGVILDYRCKWESAPFNGNWTSSFFASFDNVAIESVGLDFFRTEQLVSAEMTEVAGNVDNYLHEAALANDPPSGTFYHPNGSTALESLGVHEHWNNPTDKLYSRNLGTGYGIELIPIIHEWISTNINLSSDDRSLIVFPNPARDIISVRFLNPFIGIGRLEIFSTNGVLLYAEEIIKGDYEFIQDVNISQLKGSLILKISFKNSSYSRIILR